MNDKEKQLLCTTTGVKGNVRSITITDNVPSHWPELLNIVRASYDFYAYIYHDHDIHDDGTPVEKHIHILCVEKGGTTLKAHCARFSSVIPANMVCKVKNPRSLAKYLIHQGYEDKYQYSKENVITNNVPRYEGMLSLGSTDIKQMWSDFVRMKAGLLKPDDFMELYRVEFETMPFYQKCALMERLSNFVPLTLPQSAKFVPHKKPPYEYMPTKGDGDIIFN